MAAINWQDVITTLGGNAVLLAAAAWLIKTLVSNRLTLDVEKFKIEVKASADIEIERMKAILARASHVHDPNLPWNSQNLLASLQISEFLGWLTRRHRIALGKKMIFQCEVGEKDGEDHWFTHFQRSRGIVGVYVTSAKTRPDRVKLLQVLGTYAHWKYGARQAFGVVTEPIGAGRSYDFMLTRKAVPPEIIENQKAMVDPFAPGGELF